MREKELIIYRDFEDGGLLSDMVQLMESFKEREENRMVLYRCIHRLLEMAGHHGFYGNLWHCYLTNLLVNNENSYSKA